METRMYRQGDILLITAPIPEGKRTPVRSNVVAHGEITGHSHVVEGGDVFTVAVPAPFAPMYVVAGANGARLIHEEHDAIELPEGSYLVRRQREFDEEEARLVYD